MKSLDLDKVNAVELDRSQLQEICGGAPPFTLSMFFCESSNGHVFTLKDTPVGKASCLIQETYMSSSSHMPIPPSFDFKFLKDKAGVDLSLYVNDVRRYAQVKVTRTGLSHDAFGFFLAPDPYKYDTQLGCMQVDGSMVKKPIKKVEAYIQHTLKAFVPIISMERHSDKKELENEQKLEAAFHEFSSIVELVNNMYMPYFKGTLAVMGKEQRIPVMKSKKLRFKKTFIALGDNNAPLEEEQHGFESYPLQTLVTTPIITVRPLCFQDIKYISRWNYFLNENVVNVIACKMITDIKRKFTPRDMVLYGAKLKGKEAYPLLGTSGYKDPHRRTDNLDSKTHHSLDEKKEIIGCPTYLEELGFKKLFAHGFFKADTLKLFKDVETKKSFSILLKKTRKYFNKKHTLPIKDFVLPESINHDYKQFEKQMILFLSMKAPNGALPPVKYTLAHYGGRPAFVGRYGNVTTLVPQGKFPRFKPMPQ